VRETGIPPEEFVRKRFGPGARLDHLAGDASHRQYYRVRLPEEDSRVLMFEAGPFESQYDFFLLMAAYLERTGFPVPRVLARHPDDGVVELEDLGSLSLQHHLDGSDATEWRRLYEESVDLVIRLQQQGSAALEPDVPAYHFCLDGVRFRREMDYFQDHYVRGLLGDPPGGQADELRGWLHELAGLAGKPGDRVLCHRDYQSRNLMLRAHQPGGELQVVMIDFQDARLGPRTYDLASLLEDAYVEVPEELAAAMKQRFAAALPPDCAGAGSFDEDYALVAAQRTLKAVGTFAGQAMQKDNRSYLAYIPRALDCARRALAGAPRFSGLLQLLEGPLQLPEALRP
jgi:aminoglycoside/choline kinase family phosphotransferase